MINRYKSLVFYKKRLCNKKLRINTQLAISSHYIVLIHCLDQFDDYLKSE